MVVIKVVVQNLFLHYNFQYLKRKMWRYLIVLIRIHSMKSYGTINVCNDSNRDGISWSKWESVQWNQVWDHLHRIQFDRTNSFLADPPMSMISILYYCCWLKGKTSNSTEGNGYWDIWPIIYELQYIIWDIGLSPLASSACITAMPVYNIIYYI